MRLNFCKLCRFAENMGGFSPVMVGLFSRMHVGGFPAALDPCHLAFEIELDAIEMGRIYELEVRLIDEDGTYIDSEGLRLEMMPAPDPFPKQQFGAQRVPFRKPIVFERPGVYRFDIAVRDGDEEMILGGTALIVHQ